MEGISYNISHNHIKIVSPLLFKDLQNEGQIHIWFFDLTKFYDYSSRYLQLLTSEELKHVFRFAYEKNKARYIIAHGLIRILLSLYLNKSLLHINFMFNNWGKPILKTNVIDDNKLFFNQSYSGDFLVQAYSFNQEIGIDIENLTEFPDWLAISRRLFHPEEISFLENTKTDLKLRFFFKFWTCKEAFLKANGFSLGMEEYIRQLNFVPVIKNESSRISLQPDDWWASCLIEFPNNIISSLTVHREIENIKIFYPLPSFLEKIPCCPI